MHEKSGKVKLGKYIKKSEKMKEVSALEVSPRHESPLFLGVRTRAKILALQRLGMSPAPTDTAASVGSYLQLRSRRLEKPTIDAESKKQKQKSCSVWNPNPRARSRLRVGLDSESVVGSGCGKEEEESGQLEGEKVVVARVGEEIQENNKNGSADVGLQASYGENMLEFDDKHMDRRETTPCSLIRDPVAIRTPDSTNRPTNLTEENSAAHNSMSRHIPTAHDMDEFFSGAEVQQQKQFIEKYNFDPVNEKPLPGRYEWVKVDP